MSDPRLITAIGETLPSLARVEEPTREPFRIAAVQEAWHADADEHAAAIERGIAVAAGEGAQLVCLQELTLSPYFAITADGPRILTLGAGEVVDLAVPTLAGVS